MKDRFYKHSLSDVCLCKIEYQIWGGGHHIQSTTIANWTYALTTSVHVTLWNVFNTCHSLNFSYPESLQWPKDVNFGLLQAFLYMNEFSKQEYSI